MLFLDQESQHKYNSRANTMLQVVCQIFENYLAEHSFQALVIDAEETTAVIGVDGGPNFLTRPAAVGLASKINKQFQKKDKTPTCVLQHGQDSVFMFHVKDSQEFDNLH